MSIYKKTPAISKKTPAISLQSQITSSNMRLWLRFIIAEVGF